MHWKKDWYSLMGPLNIWAAFMAFTPIIVVEAIIGLEVFPQAWDLKLRIIALICTGGFVPLATLAESAPPFVTRQEVRWRNRNAEILFEGDVVWEDVPFLPPVFNRLRSTKGKRRPEKETTTSAVHVSPPFSPSKKLRSHAGFRPIERFADRLKKALLTSAQRQLMLVRFG